MLLWGEAANEDDVDQEAPPVTCALFAKVQFAEPKAESSCALLTPAEVNTGPKFGAFQLALFRQTNRAHDPTPNSELSIVNQVSLHGTVLCSMWKSSQFVWSGAVPHENTNLDCPSSEPWGW